MISQKDTRQIIYLGGPQKTPYWDTKQLLDQVERAINIFKEKHPNKVAVFMFN